MGTRLCWIAAIMQMSNNVFASFYTLFYSIQVIHVSIFICEYQPQHIICCCCLCNIMIQFSKIFTFLEVNVNFTMYYYTYINTPLYLLFGQKTYFLLNGESVFFFYDRINFVIFVHDKKVYLVKLCLVHQKLEVYLYKTILSWLNYEYLYILYK